MTLEEREKWKRRIMSALPDGIDRAINGDELMSRIGMHKEHKSQLRELVHELRLAARPVGSTNEGYFKITNHTEKFAVIKHLRSRTSSIEEAIDGLWRIDFDDSPERELFNEK